MKNIRSRKEEHDMKRQDFYYDLPERLIAQDPLEDRTSSRLLALNSETGKFCHRVFHEITDYLNPGDCLVINDTRVIPARLFAERVREEGTETVQAGAKVEVLLLKRLTDSRWETLVKPGKKARIGTKLKFGDGLLHGTVVDVVEEGNRIIEFSYEGIFEEILDQLGQMPLPPYITHQLQDKNRYQTVYAKNDGSAAAPTAGLHYTPELLQKIRDKGVNIAYITLHVGIGTFRPVKAENIEDHDMHYENYLISPEAADMINNTKRNGGKIICTGTTCCRTLESSSDEDGFVKAGAASTNIFIYPGYKFKCIDTLITNFHLPESTLIMLVSAFCGRENTLNAYKTAIENGYHFFSFGDSTVITDLI